MKINTRYILAAVTLVAVGAILYYFRQIVSYVVIAWVISMIGAPLVKPLRKYLGKNISAGLTLGLFALLLTLVLYIFVPPLVSQVKNLRNINYEEAFNAIEQPISDWQLWLEDKNLITPKDTIPTVISDEEKEKDAFFNQKIVIDSIINPYDSSVMKNVNLYVRIDASDLIKDRTEPKQEEVQVDFFDRLKSNILFYVNPKRIQELFTSTVSAFGDIIIGIASVFFIAFFFLREQGLFYNMVKAGVPIQYEGRTTHAIDESSKLLIRYFSGVLLQITIITIFVSIALSIFGVKNALLIAFFAAFLNVIPYIGPIIGAVFAIMITLSSNLDVDFYTIVVPKLTKVIITFGMMQALDNFVLQPTIFSKSVKAHPLEIFLIVLVGAKIGGILGMVLAIPAYTVFRVIGKVFLSEFKIIQSITKNI